MRIISLFIFAIIVVTLSCSQQKSSPIIHNQKDSAEAVPFFPVTDYIRGQLKEIESLPITPVKIIDINGRKDSLWMKKEDIRPFSEPFLHPVIDTANLKQWFSGKSFLDQTINSITFSYDPISNLPDTLQLRHWDVYIDPAKKTVNRIFIVKEIRNDDTVQTIQLTWKPNQWCKIITITEQPATPPKIKEVMMKWDFNE